MAPSHRGTKRGRSNGAVSATQRRQSQTVARTRTSHSTGSNVSTILHQNPGQLQATISHSAPHNVFPRSVASSPMSQRSPHPAADQGNSAPTERLEYLEADLDVLNEVVMALNVTERGALGCAYYVAREEKLYFMEDVQLGGADVVDALKLFVDPTVVIVSAKCPDETVAKLVAVPRPRSPTDDGRNSDPTNLPYLLECRPNGEFNYESAKNKLTGLRIGQQDGPGITYVVPGDLTPLELDSLNEVEGTSIAGRQGHLLRLSAWINLDSRIAVGCAGAVLSYLQRRRSTVFLPGDTESATMFRVGTIEMFSLSGSMFVNLDTLLSLQITSTESHPNAQQQGPSGKSWSRGAKEGLSVYGLFHHLAKTPQGRVFLRKIILLPSMNLNVINERLDTLSVLLRLDNSVTFEHLAKELAKVKNMRITTINLRKGISSGVHRGAKIATSIWHGLRQFLYSAIRITDFLSELQGGERLAIRFKVAEKFDTRKMAELGKLISGVIDFDASKEQGKTVVQTGLDDELDEARRTYAGIEDMLSEVASHVATLVPESLESTLNVIFFPQIGFLISIELAEDGLHGVYQGPPDDPWEKMFATDNHAYYKNTHMAELDERFGDIYGFICDKEIEIVQILGQRVLGYDDLLNSTSDICGELDCLMALAQGARQYNLTRPAMNTHNSIKIRKGRHPLQELTVSAFVPNGTHIAGGLGLQQELSELPDSSEQHAGFTGSLSRPGQSTSAPSMLLMTGPNYSGKSVYLKQVAIIVYMAHIGSFVPAEAADIGLTDKILTRIATRESVSREQSAFMIDLQQVSMALNIATRRTLIIIDEFGKGTESHDGAGLAAGIFQHLLDREADCPKVLAATHFHEIFESGYLAARSALGFAHMEVAVNTEASEVEEQLTYLYTYRSGRSSSSFGTCCAAMNGVAAEVITRAEGLILLAARGENLVEACAEMPECELTELADAEQIARRFLLQDAFEQPRRSLAMSLALDT